MRSSGMNSLEYDDSPVLLIVLKALKDALGCWGIVTHHREIGNLVEQCWIIVVAD